MKIYDFWLDTKNIFKAKIGFSGKTQLDEKVAKINMLRQTVYETGEKFEEKQLNNAIYEQYENTHNFSEEKRKKTNKWRICNLDTI